MYARILYLNSESNAMGPHYLAYNLLAALSTELANNNFLIVQKKKRLFNVFTVATFLNHTTGSAKILQSKKFLMTLLTTRRISIFNCLIKLP